MTDSHGPFILDPHLRLSVWTVTARQVGEDDAIARGWLPPPIPIRIPAFTPAEACQAAASMSGIDRADWNSYTWVATRKESTP